jgi:Cu(I)/Ag(I) efflux system membrane fusion protein/cobalt-zinc-cadmium efflux system membrane fusion protein
MRVTIPDGRTLGPGGPPTPLKSGNDRSSTAATKTDRRVAYWWDPMLGPSSISDKPGKSAMGMDLVPVYEDQASAGPTVRIDPTIVQNMGVRTIEVTRGSLERTIRTVGMLQVPEPGLHDITLKVGGWIDKLYADTDGMRVSKDQPLFELYSPELQVAEEELIAARRAVQALDANASEPVRQEAQAMVESSKRKLRLWDVSDQDIDAIAQADRAQRTVTLRSPADGHVVEKQVVQGSAVQVGTKLMRIEDHSKLWLDAQVYEEQLPWVEMGQAVTATVDGVPDRTFTGKVTFVYPHVDHMTRTTTVRTMIENPDHELRPGMYATANITARLVQDAVLVPREAVIDTGTRQFAFVSIGEGRFQPRKVRMGMRGDERVQILEGLAQLQPTTLATMHGSSYVGDGSRALRELSVVMQEVLGPRVALAA